MKVKSKTFTQSLFPRSALFVAALAVLSAQAQAEEKAAPAGLLNDYLREKDSRFETWDIGGQIRARFEDKEYFAAPGVASAADFATKGDNSNAYFLLREKIHIGYTPEPWLTVFAEGRDSSEQGDDRSPSPDRDMIDLHQAYFKLGDAKSFPLALKAGRQELIYGDERLIGGGDWNNVPRSFDAIKLRYDHDLFWVDAFAARPVVPQDGRFNTSNDYDNFFGLYGGANKLIPKTDLQLYFLSRNVSTASPTAVPSPIVGLPSARDIYTIGGRLKSLPGELGGWDYEVEGAYQTGHFKSPVTGINLDQGAFAAHIAGGYAWNDTQGKPRLGLDYNYSSGDNNPADGSHGTFDNLFPTNHKFYGNMDFFSWQNMQNLRFTSAIKPLPGLTITGDYHLFWLADTHDFFYTAAGSPRTLGGYGANAAGSFVGSEINIVATYAIKPFAIVQGGFGHFFVSDYVKNSLAATGGSHDANWFYAQMLFNF